MPGINSHKAQIWCQKILDQINKQKNLEEEKSEKKVLILFFPFLKSPASGKENVRFPDSPDFEISLDFRTGYDVW